MSVNFSTIGQMNTSTISKPPAFSTAAPEVSQPQMPAASTRINTPDSDYEPEKKKSHWLLKTIGAAVVIVGGLAAARKWCPGVKEIILEKELAKDAKFGDKCKYYLAKAGQYITDKAKLAYESVVGIFDKSKKPKTETPKPETAK